MRLWQLLAAVALAAVAMALARDPTWRVFLIAFTTGLGEVGLGLIAVMALFQTVGAVGLAKGGAEHAEAVVATTAVLTVASGLMSAWFFAGCWLIWATC